MSTGRIQLALNVSNVDEATAFYTQLFGVAPHKQREGYANFVIADPPSSWFFAKARTSLKMGH